MLFPGNNDLDGVLAFVVLTAFVIEGRLFFNLFGYDAYCLDRFRLAPVSGAAILKEKNAALFIAMTIQYLPFFILSLIASGIASAIFLFLVSCVCWVAYTIWGNVSSLLLITPSVMKDGANSSQNDRFMNVCASILPLFAVYYVKEMLSSVSVLITTLIGIVSLGLCIVVYITLIPRQGRYFERKIEEVVTELSVQ